MSNTLDVCQTGYDYERYQLNELENDNMKIKNQLSIATKALHYYAEGTLCSSVAQQALKEMEEVGNIHENLELMESLR